MPATYAHFRFGREVLRRLSPETREAIAPRIQLYHIGLHGPDIFFYYHPLSKNPVQALGGQLHLLSGREIFTRMEAVRDRYPADSRRGLDAYIFGFICHYAPRLLRPRHRLQRHQRDRRLPHGDRVGLRPGAALRGRV